MHQSTRALVVLLLLGACTDKQEPISLTVAGSEAALSFVADIKEPSDLLPDAVDLCWVDDTNRTRNAANDAAYQAKKDHIQSVVGAWTEGTSLTFNWLASCRPAVVTPDNTEDYGRDEIRIYLDAPPFENAGRRLPGLNCPGHLFRVANWASFPNDRKNFCAVNMVMDDWINDATALHEMGHALGLMHEHARVDTPEMCSIYAPQAGTAGLNLAIPDSNLGTALVYPLVVAADPQLPAVVQRVHFHVEIAHTRPADLDVVLISPSGRTAVLHNRTANDPHYILDTELGNELDPLLGSPFAGTWSLVVTDRVLGVAGTLATAKLTLNKSREQGDSIYATGYSTESVMHYGPFPEFTGCPALGNGGLTGLSDGDHLAVQMAYSTGNPPISGEGYYRDDATIALGSMWIARGARIGDTLNTGFLSDFSWNVARMNGTPIVTSTGSSLSTSAITTVGSYRTFLAVDDFWGRRNIHNGTLNVVGKSLHTAIMSGSFF
jgi:subtilisin-like proprotein convertase family protein